MLRQIAVIGVLIAAAVAVGQVRVDQGKPGVQGPWPVAVTADGGPLVISVLQTQQSAFGELLTAQVTIPLFFSFANNVINPETIVTNTDGGTVTADGGHIILTVSDAGTYADIRSRQAARYVPGQGIATRFTFVSSGCAAGQQQTIGIGNGDGYFFGCCPACETDGGYAFAILRRASIGGDFWTPASQWNGAWGHTPPDITKGRAYQIQYQWLGYGQIVYFIEEATTGQFVVAHSIKYSGTATETSVQNPILPLNMHVNNIASNAINSLRSPSMSILRQGEEPQDGLRRSINGARGLTTTENEVLAIRDNSTFNGFVNRVQSRLDFISWSATGAAGLDITIRIRLNPNLIATAFTNINSSYSISAWDTDGGYSPDGGYFSNGITWMTIIGEGGSAGSLNLHPYQLHLTPGDVVAVTAQSSSGTPSLRVALSWVEEF